MLKLSVNPLSLCSEEPFCLHLFCARSHRRQAVNPSAVFYLPSFRCDPADLTPKRIWYPHRTTFHSFLSCFSVSHRSLKQVTWGTVKNFKRQPRFSRGSEGVETKSLPIKQKREESPISSPDKQRWESPKYTPPSSPEKGSRFFGDSPAYRDFQYPQKHDLQLVPRSLDFTNSNV